MAVAGFGLDPCMASYTFGYVVINKIFVRLKAYKHLTAFSCQFDKSYVKDVLVH